MIKDEYVTKEEFYDYKINNDNHHEHILQEMNKIREDFEIKFTTLNTVQNSINFTQSRLENNQKDLTKSINDIKSDFDEFKRIKNEMKEVVNKISPALSKFNIANEYVKKQIDFLTNLDIENKKPFFKKVLRYWPIIAGVFVFLGFVLGFGYKIVNWSLDRGLVHFDRVSKHNMVIMTESYNNHRAYTDSCNLKIAYKVDSLGNKMELINLKISTLHKK